MLKSPLKVGRDEPPFPVAGEARPHPGRVALRGRGHRLGPRVNRSDRPAELPRRDREQRLYRDVELAAEPAADRRGDDVHPPGLDPENARGLVAIHVRGLGAREDPDALADPLGVARFRLDVRVLDEAGRELALGHVRRRGDRRVDVALHDPAADKDVVGVRRVDRLARVRERFLDLGLRGLQASSRIGISSSPIASTACCSPTRHSTASPRKRTRPSASTGWSFTSGKMPKLFTGTSRAVMTSTSPGCAARNGPKSPSVKRALACGERMVRSQSAPAGAASAA